MTLFQTVVLILLLGIMHNTCADPAAAAVLRVTILVTSAIALAWALLLLLVYLFSLAVERQDR